MILIINQLKQDYVYSRYLLYLFQTQNSLHFADKDTYLTNLYDYPQYSIRVENGKTAFKLLYAILDKVAFFANIYWNLGIKIRDVNFNSIWREKSGGKKSVYQHKSLDYVHNRALNSVRWIYKDFNDSFGEAQNPFIKKLNHLRNALEHRYVKVHSSILHKSEEPYPYHDSDGTYHISDELLGSYTFELISIVRELIIDLTMAVHIEEKKYKENTGLTVEMSLYEYNDEWKI